MLGAFFAKILKPLFVGVCCLIILLALTAGGFRLLFTQLPSYQSELKAWVARELGVEVGFDHLDARWGLRGPELSFRDATVGASGQAEPFLLAREASVSIDPWALMTELQFAVDRLTLTGTRVTVLRTEDGRMQVQGAPLESASRLELGLALPPEVEVLVRDSELVYTDRVRAATWRFTDVTMSIDREPGQLSLEARAVAPSALADRVEVAIERSPETGADGWRLFADLRGADLAALDDLIGMADPSLEGSGDISLWLDWVGGRVERGTAQVALDRVVLQRPDAPQARYERLALTAEWMDGPSGQLTLALNDVELRRGGRAWAGGGNSTLRVARAGDRIDSVAVQSDFLRLEDLTPIVSLVPDSALARRWLALEPRGDVSALELTLARAGGAWDYRFAGRFADLEARPLDSWPGVSGLSGDIRADSRTGRVHLETPTLALEWPAVFREPVEARDVSGIVVWRQGRNVVRVVSDDLSFDLHGGVARSNLELTLPLDGGAPSLDMRARLTRAELVDAKRLLPAHVMPPPVVDWLDRAIQGGSAHDIEFTFFGALDAFPFDDGGGQMRVTADVEDARLEFVDGWPRAEALSGAVDFHNAGFSARGRGRVLGNRSEDVRIGIADMRDPLLTIGAQTQGSLADVLAFINGAPLVAQHLGPGYSLVQAHGGIGRVDLDLELPLLERDAYRLDASLEIADGELSVSGFPPRATDVSGILQLADSEVTAQGLEANFLDGPVSASVAAAAREGYRARLDVEGETGADAVQRAFGWSLGDAVAGQTRWRGSLLIPARSERGDAPVRIEVASNLTGLSLKLPAPFSKGPAEPTNLELRLVFAGADRLEVSGHVGATRRFALRYADEGDGLVFARGGLQFGGGQPRLPPHGLTIAGSLPHLDFGDWLDLTREPSFTPGRFPLVGAELDLAEFFAFGQELGRSRLSVQRDAEHWHIDVGSETIAGSVTVPRRLSSRPQIVADMQRLYLAAGGTQGNTGAGLPADPRELPGLSLSAADFAVGMRRLGSVEAQVRADPRGLRLTSFESAGLDLSVSAIGSWLVGPEGQTTRVAAGLHSTDLAAALEQLGFDPLIEGELAEATANLHWRGPPGAGWMRHVGGDLTVRVETGSMLDIEPGAGRMVGLMSIAALPRRLELDFRDVFNKGLVFDEIAGDFVIVDGDAYTDNLKLSGPGAEVGVIGRTGLRDRDYEQQAVVTAEPGNVLPTVGGLLGGPGVGAALLIFTRIFKEPLKGIGQASYCVRGSWDEPVVDRLTPEQLQQDRLCAALPPVPVVPAESDERSAAAPADAPAAAPGEAP